LPLLLRIFTTIHAARFLVLAFWIWPWSRYSSATWERWCNQREATAGVQPHRARGLHAGGVRGGHRHEADPAPVPRRRISRVVLLLGYSLVKVGRSRLFRELGGQGERNLTRTISPARHAQPYAAAAMSLFLFLLGLPITADSPAAVRVQSGHQLEADLAGSAG